MKRIIFLLVIAVLILVPAMTLAQNDNTNVNTNTTSEEVEELETEIEQELEDPGLLPDSPFYFVKNWSEKIQSMFTFGDDKKAELEYKFAMRRIAEINKLVEKDKMDQAIKHMENYEEHLAKFTERVEKLKDKKPEKTAELLDKLEASQIRQQSVLADVYNKVPESAQAGILNAMENSSKGLENAIEQLENKAELDNYMERVEGRLNNEFKNKSEDVKNKLKNRLNIGDDEEESEDIE
ncbi:MAG: DUF5667 domain-containing protein [bacterium]|nr:DUF5667 domain-containing protein [bacterium]